MTRSKEWAAGLFEGEGTILIRKRPLDQIALSLSSTDEDIVRAFRDVVDYGKVYGPYCYGTNRKSFWKWNCDNGEVTKNILTDLLPFFGERRSKKAIDAIARWKHRQSLPYYSVSRKGMGGRAKKKT